MRSQDRLILWLDECSGELLSTVGGKCAGLGELLKAGVAVPPGFAVTTNAHRAFLDEGELDERIATLQAEVDFYDVRTIEAASEQIRTLIEATELPEAVVEAISRAYEELGARSGAGSVPVAVRSSAVAEDLAAASFAGQLQTYLWIEGAGEVLSRTRRAWAGFFTPSALTYRRQMGLESERALMCVGVQQMVEPRAAGVMFTLNPLTGDPSKIMIEASWGLGESVVSGDVDPDRYLVDKVTGEIIERTIANKALEHRFDPDRGAVVSVPVAAERAGQACLSDAEVSELAATGKHIERFQGSARDIEWALVDGPPSGPGEIRILQSRGETVWSQRRREKPIVERKDSAVEYVLAELLNLGGGRSATEPRKDS
jgi:pyruvate,water dikinase